MEQGALHEQPTVSFEEFKKLSIKVAQIKEVKDHPNADKLYLMTIDVGGENRQIVAGIKPHYRPEELKGKKIVVIDNLEPAQIRGIESEAMLLAAQDASNLAVIVPDKDIAIGAKVK